MLYHISIVELKEKELKFIPRVPKFKLDNEDDTIPRICVSDNIEGCLTGIGYDISKVLWIQYAERHQIPLYVYGIDESKINRLLKPQEVVQYVDDALKNNEYWILEPVKLEYIKTISLSQEMYDMFEAKENEDLSYDDIIHNYLKNNKYKYEDFDITKSEISILKIEDTKQLEDY